jgi:hypothetical protein
MEAVSSRVLMGAVLSGSSRRLLCPLRHRSVTGVKENESHFLADLSPSGVTASDGHWEEIEPTIWTPPVTFVAFERRFRRRNPSLGTGWEGPGGGRFGSGA